MSARGSARDAPRKTPSQGGYLLAKAHQIAGRVFARLLKESGGSAINPAQGRILFALWKADGGLSMSALSAETALEPSTLTSMIDRLEAAGLVLRRAAPGDRRACVIECSAAGRKIEEDYGEASARMTKLFYAGMGAAEIEAFEACLRRIVGNLSEAERDRG